jgi:large subunit ribosomal protein L18
MPTTALKTSKERRKLRTRKKIFGTGNRPRLSVFRSNKYIYAQLIDDENGRTITSASGDKKTESAFEVGKKIAEQAKKHKIKSVVFDKGSYKYHGRVKSLADGAREGGLEF